MRLVAFLLTLASTMAVPRASATEPWRLMAENDLRFIHDTIAAHHPGPLDDQNPAFRDWHEQGLKESLALLERVDSYGGYRAAIQQYVAGFRDGHLVASLDLEYRNVGWPRFMVAWREGGIRVHHVEARLQAPAVGARLVECDGKSADSLFAERVVPFGGFGIAADRYKLVPELFIDRINPLLDQLERCTFEHDDEKVEVELDWNRRRWPDLREHWIQATDGPRGDFEIREVAAGGVWLSLPTFGPRGEQLERMKAIMAALPGHRSRNYVVVDVRRNGGGASYWGEAFVRGLYGDAYFEMLRDEDEGERDSYVVHRVSADNAKHFEEMLDYIADQAGKDSAFYRYFAALSVGIDKALADGQDLYDHRYEEEEDEPDEVTAAEPLYRGTVYFLTDGTCASSCLNVADLVLKLPGAVHVGQPTSADTVYMEVRNVKLPSRNGKLTFATKVIRNRQRGHNEDYTPVHEWRGDIWNTDQLERWILSLQRSP